MSVDATVSLAARLLGATEEETRGYAVETDNPSLTYYSVPTKGGSSLIVSDEGEVLYANSSVNYDQHMDEYLKGTRTPLSAFGNLS